MSVPINRPIVGILEIRYGEKEKHIPSTAYSYHSPFPRSLFDEEHIYLAFTTLAE